MVELLWITVLVAILLVVLYKLLGIRTVIIYEYQRGLRYQRGRFVGVVPPAQYWLFLRSTHIVPLDVRPTFVTVPGQEVLTADGVSVKISVAAQFEVEDPNLAINKNAAYVQALYMLLQMAVRTLVSGEKIASLMEARADLSKRLNEAVAADTKKLGVRLISADIKDLMLPGDLKKVFAQVVKAEREGLAALERARGESAALRNLANAAKMIEDNPNLLQLRALQAMGEGTGNTLVFGIQPEGMVNAKGRQSQVDKS